MEFRIELSAIVNHILALVIYHAFIHRPLREMMGTQGNTNAQRTNQRRNQRQRHHCQRRRMQ